MYIFKIKISDWDSSLSYSFPTKSPKKRGTSGIVRYDYSKGGLGWFKCKSEKVAIKSFIPMLRRNINNVSNTGYSNKEREQKNLKFLNDLMRETKFRYLDTYPEAFI